MAPSEFCRLLDDVFRDIQWIECLFYMDDTIIRAKVEEESLIRLEHVFQRLQNVFFSKKLSKIFQSVGTGCPHGPR